MAVKTIRSRLYLLVKPILSAILPPLFMVVCPVSIASMQVSPTQIFIAAERNAAGLTLINTNDASLYAQVRVFEWRQQDGENQLLPTQAIVASPPMLILKPGVYQLIRIVRNSASPATTETSYRIIIDEVPMSTNADKEITNQTKTTHADGLQFRLRYSIPVFLAPSKHITVQPILNTQLIKDSGTHFLQISNEGNAHAHIADLTWSQGEQRKIIASGLAGYILPEQQRQWQLPDDLSLINGGTFTARINGEFVERILVPITAMD